jgi:hypothetical protein
LEYCTIDSAGVTCDHLDSPFAEVAVIFIIQS